MGRFLVWLTQPVIPFVIAPLYQIVRRQWRRYLELSENPWERRRLVLTSQPSVVFIGALVIFLLTAISVRASTAPGVIVGSRSILLTHLVQSEADWQAADIATGPESEFAEQIPTTMYRSGGSIAYVFPYTGDVGPAPAGDESPDVPTQKPEPQKVEPIQRYAVQRGDTLARIAKKFNLKIDTLLWANNLVTNSVLRPGDTVVVPAVDGIIYTVKSGGTLSDVAKKYNVTTKQLALANNISAAAQLKKGQALVIPGANPPSVPKVPTPTPKPTPAPTPEPQPEPQPAPELVADNPTQNDVTPVTPEIPVEHPDVIARPPLAPGEKLLWPTRRHSVTQYFSGGHPGVDIDGDYTDPVYAADGGTVIYSGWNNGGYGNMILIDHGNGMVTRYGHNSKVFVAVGQQVSRGDVISMVGTTGRSTGSHLHFEVIMSGKRVNPIKYIR